MSQEAAEARGWVFDTTQTPPLASLGDADPRVVRHGGSVSEVLSAIEAWESHQAARKEEFRHPFYKPDPAP